MATEPSRRHFGGQTAVQSLLGATTEPVRGSDARLGARSFRASTTRRRAVPLALGSVTRPTLVIGGARALGGPAPAHAAPVAPHPLPAPTPAPAPAPAASASEQRFTGRVGTDLSAA